MLSTAPPARRAMRWAPVSSTLQRSASTHRRHEPFIVRSIDGHSMRRRLPIDVLATSVPDAILAHPAPRFRFSGQSGRIPSSRLILTRRLSCRGDYEEGQPMKSTLSRDIQTRGLVLISLVILLLIGLPLVVWLDLKNLTEANLRRQAGDLNSVVSSVRNYYASNVVGRILASPGSAQVAHNYESISGAIPIPATLSLELGQVISEQQQNITYRFVSDYPFANRTPHVLDGFERSSLAALRANPSQQLADVSWSALADRVRLIVPVVMGAACVNCHNAHPESTKHDWKVGDVRGIQEVIITQATASNILSFKYLLTYFSLMAACGTTFIGWQRRQAATIKGM